MGAQCAELRLPLALQAPIPELDEVQARILVAAKGAVALAEAELVVLEREQRLAVEQGASWDGGTRLRLLVLTLKTAGEVLGGAKRSAGKGRPR